MPNHETPDVDYAPNGAVIIPAPGQGSKKPAKRKQLSLDGEAPEPEGKEMEMIGKSVVIHMLGGPMHELITVLEMLDVVADQMEEISQPRWPGVPSMNTNPNAQMDPSKAFRPGK